MKSLLHIAGALAALFAAGSARAQDNRQPDRADPAVIQRELHREEAQPQPRQSHVTVSAPERGTAAAPAGEVMASAIRVTGARRVPVAAFAGAIEPYLARPLAQADLVRLATDVAGVMRRQGYGLATAWVPAQDLVGGTLRVEVDEGRIDAVHATGPGARLVEQGLASLTGDGPVRTAELERRLLIVGDMAGLWVGEARLARQGGRNVLTVSTRYEHASAMVRIDNWGTQTVGPIRAWAEMAVNGVAARGDGLTLGLAATPLDPREFQFGEVHYRLPFGGRGTTVGVGGYFGHSRSRSEDGSIVYDGRSSEVEVEMVQPLTRSRARSAWLTGTLSLRNSDLDQDGILVRADRLATASAAIYGYQRVGHGRVRGRLAVMQGLGLLGATRLGDPLASRDDASGTFTKLEGWAEYWRPLSHGFSLELGMRSQWSDGPLLASEEMGLGGPQFLRAYDYRTLAGDQGVAGYAELRFDLKHVGPVETLQLYGFADAGRVRDAGAVTRRDSLASTGGGVRARIGRGWDAGAELAFPLSDSGRNWDPKPRFSFSLTSRF
jgi:hemolysin activation/secretion protein